MEIEKQKQKQKKTIERILGKLLFMGTLPKLNFPILFYSCFAENNWFQANFIFGWGEDKKQKEKKKYKKNLKEFPKSQKKFLVSSY